MLRAYGPARDAGFAVAPYLKRYKAIVMEKYMKKYLAFLAIALFPLTVCAEQNPTNNASQTEYERQARIYDEQAKKASEQQAETDRQLQVSAKHMEISIAQQKRMEKLLERWEKQADRYDAILDKWEKQK